MTFIRKIKRGDRVYLAEVENHRHDGKVRQKFIRYIGVEPNNDKKLFPSSNDELAFDGAKVYGSIICLDSIARQIGLHDLLGSHAPSILSLVYCHCHDYRSVVDAERWVRKTDICRIFNVAEITEKQLRNGLSYLDDLDSFAFQKSIFENMTSLFDHQLSSAVVYDVTNTYLEGERSRLARVGKDKEGVKGRRLIQIGLAITKEHGIPIFHQVHRGNVHDSKIFKEAIVNLERRGFKSGTIVHDRGMTAKSSILQLSSLHWKVIAGMPMQRYIKSKISKMDFSRLENFRNRVEQGSTVFYVTTESFIFGGVSGKLVILLNPLKMQAQKEDRRRKIAEAREQLSENEKIDESLEKFFTKDKTVNAHAIKREENFDGISILFTNAKISREEIVKLYFEKDIIEKSFQLFKGGLAIRPIRHWLDEHIKAHVMICYLAYCLLTTFRFLLYKNRAKKHLIDISVTNALDELSEVYRVYYRKKPTTGKQDRDSEHLFSKVITMTECQSAILKAVDPNISV